MGIKKIRRLPVYRESRQPPRSPGEEFGGLKSQTHERRRIPISRWNHMVIDDIPVRLRGALEANRVFLSLFAP